MTFAYRHIQTRRPAYAECEERRGPDCRREAEAEDANDLDVLLTYGGWVELHTGKVVCPECLTRKAKFLRDRVGL